MSKTEHHSQTVTLKHNEKQKDFTVEQVICIGYSGRNQEKVQEHIDELADMGIPRPPQVPTLFPMRLTSVITNGKMQVIGEQTSGEAELVFIFGDSEEEVFVTVGSDHTDRELETVHIGKSKQVCEKPVAETVWKVEEVEEHWDEMILKTDIQVNGEWSLYQEEKVSAILPFEKIKNALKDRNIQLIRSIFYAGTVPLKDGFKFGEAYKMSLIDPVKEREIELHYSVKELTV